MGEEPLIVILAILVVVSVIAVISCIYAYHKRKENQKLQEEISGIQQGENEDLNHQNSQKWDKQGKSKRKLVLEVLNYLKLVHDKKIRHKLFDHIFILIHSCL